MAELKYNVNLEECNSHAHVEKSDDNVKYHQKSRKKNVQYTVQRRYKSHFYREMHNRASKYRLDKRSFRPSCKRQKVVNNVNATLQSQIRNNMEVPFTCTGCQFVSHNIRSYIIHVKDVHLKDYIENSHPSPKNHDGENTNEIIFEDEKSASSFSDNNETSSKNKNILLINVTACNATLALQAIKANNPDENINSATKASDDCNKDGINEITSGACYVPKVGGDSASNVKSLRKDDANNFTNEVSNIIEYDVCESSYSLKPTFESADSNSDNSTHNQCLDKLSPDNVSTDSVNTSDAPPCIPLSVPNQTNSKSNSRRVSSKLEDIVHSLKDNLELILPNSESLDVSRKIFDTNNSDMEIECPSSPSDIFQLSNNHTKDTRQSKSSPEMSGVERGENDLGLKVLSIESCSDFPMPQSADYCDRNHADTKISVASRHAEVTSLQMLVSSGLVTMPSAEILSTIDSNPSTWTTLQTSFSEFPYPPLEEILHLSSITQLTVAHVKSWFVGARLKHGISWSPDEVVDAWTFIMKPNNKTKNFNQTSRSTEFMSNVNLTGYTNSSTLPELSNTSTSLHHVPKQTSFDATCTDIVGNVFCTCGVKHQLTAQQYEVLASTCQSDMNYERMANIQSLTGLAPCAIISFYQRKYQLYRRPDVCANPTDLQATVQYESKNLQTNFPQQQPQKCLRPDYLNTSAESDTEPIVFINEKRTGKKTYEQLQVLHNSFAICPFLSTEEKERIEFTTGMCSRTITKFFADRRCGIKRKLRKMSLNSHWISIYEGPENWLRDVAMSRKKHQEFLDISSCKNVAKPSKTMSE